MRSALFAGMFGLFGLVVAFAPGSYADDEEREEQEEAVLSFKGKRGGPVTVEDHRAGEKEVFKQQISILNQSTPEAMRAADARQEARQAAREAAVDAEATAEAEAKNGEQSQDGAPTVETDDDEIDVAEGLRQLQQQNWITFSADERHFPEQVYNPQTKQFVPTLEAIKSLESPPEPVTPEQGAATASPPPPPRKSDPTP